MDFNNVELRFPEWVDLNRWTANQQPVFEEICARFDEGNRLVLLDNPCGGGKSLLAYMVHQYLSTSGYYLVGTKNLQDQIERTLGLPVIKGRANYIPLNVQEYDEHTWRDPTCADCDYDSRTDLCTYCDRPSDCPYDTAKDHAAAHSLPCANYSYALGEWTSPRSRFRRGLIICDESDTIADELLSFVSVDISPRMQERLNLRPPSKKTVESAWEQWFSYAIPHIEKERSFIRGDSLQNKRRRMTLERLLDKLRFIAKDLEDWVYEYDNDYISFKPVTVDKLAPEYLWRHGERFLCMSGSGGSPEQFVNDLGFTDSWAPVFAPSTFDVSKRPIYLCPSARMTQKLKDEEWPKMAQAFLETIEMFPDAKILVHTHSYALTRYLMDAYTDYYFYVEKEENGPRRVFAYTNGGEKADAVKFFEEVDNAVLLAPSLDRGYDNPDIDICIICKVPSPYLGSKQVQKRLRGTPGGEGWYANETIKTLVQSYGRVMRSEDDEGMTIVLDTQFTTFHGRWKRWFPTHFNEAIHTNSDVRFELRQRVKRSTLKVSSA